MGTTSRPTREPRGRLPAGTSRRSARETRLVRGAYPISHTQSRHPDRGIARSAPFRGRCPTTHTAWRSRCTSRSVASTRAPIRTQTPPPERSTIRWRVLDGSALCTRPALAAACRAI